MTAVRWDGLHRLCCFQPTLFFWHTSSAPTAVMPTLKITRMKTTVGLGQRCVQSGAIRSWQHTVVRRRRSTRESVHGRVEQAMRGRRRVSDGTKEAVALPSGSELLARRRSWHAMAGVAAGVPGTDSGQQHQRSSTAVCCSSNGSHSRNSMTSQATRRWSAPNGRPRPHVRGPGEGGMADAERIGPQRSRQALEDAP